MTQLIEMGRKRTYFYFVVVVVVVVAFDACFQAGFKIVCKTRKVVKDMKFTINGGAAKTIE